MSDLLLAVNVTGLLNRLLEIPATDLVPCACCGSAFHLFFSIRTGIDGIRVKAAPNPVTSKSADFIFKRNEKMIKASAAVAMHDRGGLVVT
jgi:hypothetical protein